VHQNSLHQRASHNKQERRKKKNNNEEHDEKTRISHADQAQSQKLGFHWKYLCFTISRKENGQEDQTKTKQASFTTTCYNAIEKLA
jgi:hypothetical protein